MCIVEGHGSERELGGPRSPELSPVGDLETTVQTPGTSLTLSCLSPAKSPPWEPLPLLPGRPSSRCLSKPSRLCSRDGLSLGPHAPPAPPSRHPHAVGGRRGPSCLWSSRWREGGQRGRAGSAFVGLKGKCNETELFENDSATPWDRGRVLTFRGLCCHRQFGEVAPAGLPVNTFKTQQPPVCQRSPLICCLSQGCTPKCSLGWAASQTCDRPGSGGGRKSQEGPRWEQRLGVRTSWMRKKEQHDELDFMGTGAMVSPAAPIRKRSVGRLVTSLNVQNVAKAVLASRDTYLWSLVSPGSCEATLRPPW